MCRQQGLRGLILLVLVLVLVLVRLRLLPLLRQPSLSLLMPPPLPRLYSKLRRVRKQSRAHKLHKQRKPLSLRLTHRPRLSRHRLLPLQPPRSLMLPVHMQPKQRLSQNPSLLTTILSRPGKMLPSLPVQGPAMTLQSLPQQMQTLTPVPRPVSLKKLRLQLLTAALLRPPKRHRLHPFRPSSQPQSPLPQPRQTPLPTL
jgi:hypothetical protein